MPLTINTVLNKAQDFGPCRIADSFFAENEETKETEIHVRLEPRANVKACCSQCGRQAPGYDTLEERSWLHIPILCFAACILYAPRRVQCPDCGVKVEALPWSDGKNHCTIPFMQFLARWARRLSWKQVADIFGVDWNVVRKAVAWLVNYGLANRDLEGVTAIGVDELHWRRGKKAANFMTLIYQIDGRCRRLLHVGERRTEKALRDGLKELESTKTGFCEGIKVVCSDMWRPFLNVIKAKLPSALNVLDKFHVAAHLNKAVDETRRGEQARLTKAARKQVKGSRFVLLKRGTRVRGKARAKLKATLAALYETSQAWVLKEGFQKFWKYRSPTWAGAWLTEWIALVKRSKIAPMIRVANMLERHHDLLLNYFRARREYSSAVVEGLNNKARVSLSQSYGHRSPEIMRLALYHALAKLPEPPFTHRFC
jgi:transposase